MSTGSSSVPALYESSPEAIFAAEVFTTAKLLTILPRAWCFINSFTIKIARAKMTPVTYPSQTVRTARIPKNTFIARSVK